ncbi:TolC family protein, partial [Spirochaetota bacterium]
MKKNIIIIILTVFVFETANTQPVKYFVVKALKNSPMVKAQSYKVLSSKYKYRSESILQKNPVFSFNYQNVPLVEWPTLNSHAMSGIVLGLSQYIASPFESYYRKKVAQKIYLSDVESLNEVRNNLAFQVQSTYHKLQFLHEKKKILRDNLLVLKDILKIAESLVSVNKMSSSNLLKIRADSSILKNKIIEVEGDIISMRSTMEKLCGLAVDWSNFEKGNSKWIDKKKARVVPRGFHFKNHPIYKKVLSIYSS